MTHLRHRAARGMTGLHPDSGSSGGVAGNGELDGRVDAVLDGFTGWTTETAVHDRIGVASWTDWFPAAGYVHSSFFGLTCRQPSPMTNGDRTAQALTKRRYEAADWNPLAVLSSAAILLQTPTLLRSRLPSPDPRATLLEASGATSVPVAPPRRPERTKGHALGDAKGATGPAGVPVRLGWPGDHPRLQPHHPLRPSEPYVVARRPKA